MTIKYKNTSKFYKQLVLNGRRVNIPPNGIISSERELDLSVYTYLSKTDDKEEPTVSYVDERKKSENVNSEQYEKLEKALLILNEKSLSERKIRDIIKEELTSSPKIEEAELENLAKELKEIKQRLKESPIEEILNDITQLKEKSSTVDRRQHVLKDAIDEVNDAVMQLEKYVYEGDWDSNTNIVIVDDETQKDTVEKSTEPSIEDILNGS